MPADHPKAQEGVPPQERELHCVSVQHRSLQGHFWLSMQSIQLLGFF